MRPGQAFSCRLINALHLCHTSSRQWRHAFRSSLVETFSLSLQWCLCNPHLYHNIQSRTICLWFLHRCMWSTLFWRIFSCLLSQFHHGATTQHQSVGITNHTRFPQGVAWQTTRFICRDTNGQPNQCECHTSPTFNRPLYLQRCIRDLWLLLALHNIHFFARDIPGNTNILADALSRFYYNNTYSENVHHAVNVLGLTHVVPDQGRFLFTID